MATSSYTEVTEHHFIKAFLKASITSVIVGVQKLRPIEVK